MQKPTVVIAHSIPGRIRVYLSVWPGDTDKFLESVKGHAGLESVAYTGVTRAVLVHFDPRQVTAEEVVMRVALALSLCVGDTPVVILKKPESGVLTNSAAVTGVLAATAFALKGFGSAETARAWGRAAALGTGAVVLQHGWREVREQGYFDPEVLSLGYLVAAMARGDFARGALITWMIVFGRHLLAAADQGVEVRPMRQDAGPDMPRRYEIVVAHGESRRAPLFSVLQSLAGYLSVAEGPGLINELRAVSSAHGEVMDGLGRMHDGIRMSFR